MKRFLGFILILMMFTSIELFAVTIDIKAPQIIGGGGLTAGDIITLNTQLTSIATDFQQQLYGENLNKLGHQNKLATGFGNASAYSANSASFSGYEGYDIFAFMWGISAGVKIPSNMEIKDGFKDKVDFDFGVAISTAFNLGINLTALGLDFLPNRLYMNIKGLKLSIDDAKDWSFKMTTFGIGFNYQLVDRGGDRFRLFKWTGLSVSTGFLYNKNKINFNYELDEYTSDNTTSGIPGYELSLIFTPDTNFGLDVKTYTIPIEISTSVRLLWLFNFTLGAGIDMAFGTSKIIAAAKTEVYLRNNSGTSVNYRYEKGTAIIDGTTSDKPNLLNPKILGGLGLCLGPIPIDVRATYYLGRNGLAVNVGTGIVW